MLNFIIDESKCTKCGLCAVDCPTKIIDITNGIPFIQQKNEGKCMGCQHCLAVCPVAALSILGVDPDACVDVRFAAAPDAMDALIRSRRSVRQFKKVNISAEKMEQLIKAAANAPTGKNNRGVALHIIDNIEDMDIFREEVISHLEKLDKEGRLTGQYQVFSTFAKAFRKGNDIIFRGGPNLVVASVPKESPTPSADGIIALSYMELMAATLGLGAVWLGFLMHIFALAPELKGLLSIPADHDVSYVLLLGEPSVKYSRGVMRDEISVNRVSFRH
ncbi:nitroreductase [Denitrovibrio acetiphilus DSM 12809]|uniref:Nitroreductase n=1 Tax=Denitrovibrio acetiphilus (strain DSM 12809 / NBRC 114555 / N2460) TaxID=522772 RepID=D4H4E6_DENA2|nr:nitroreductase family protein [Denitrovibrio acetiphilus]ADD69275.1 nitroreductase [Denitrovibrio acetiphilus DSM 12809]